MDRGAWWATVHGVAKSRTRLSTHEHKSTEFRGKSLNNTVLLLRLACVALLGR